MLLHAAIGDAYGAGFEFQTADFIKKNNHLKAYFSHGLYTEIKGRYTDDTQMALALAELLLENNETWTHEIVADKFVQVFQRDKRRGYSDRMYNALDTSKNGQGFLQIIDNQSTANGSAMRVYPLGYIKDVQKLLSFATIQAQVSHDTHEGIEAAKRIALTMHYYIYDYQNVSLLDFLKQYVELSEPLQIVAPIEFYGFPTTNAVLKLVENETDMKKCLKDGIDFGGDTDTVAALSMAILSVKTNHINNLPQFLFDELENGEFGRDYLMEIDSLLKRKIL
jgi:ADP-ribosylglycohydrolase